MTTKLKPPKTRPVPKSLSGGLSVEDAALAAAIGDKKICRTCVRDPDKIRSAKVISNGQCAACYNRDRRKAKAEEEGRRLAPAPSRAGAAVEERITVRTSTDFKTRMEKVAQELGKSVSDWAASHLEPALLKDEAKAAARMKRAAAR